MSQVVISLQDVWKVYQMGDVQVQALTGLSLNIKKGEFLAIMGASGSGKSTAMNMIGCLDVPTRGRIFLNNHNIAHLDESHLASIRGRTIGFIFQQFNLIPTLTALENVMLPMIFQGVPRDKRISKATELLNSVGLGDRINHRPSELSGGQQQRVAIARALCNDPDVILADEPTGNLDSVTGKEILSLLTDLHEKHGKTVIMVTHDQYVASCADRVELLTDGHIIADGKSVLRKLRGVKNE